MTKAKFIKQTIHSNVSTDGFRKVEIIWGERNDNHKVVYSERANLCDEFKEIYTAGIYDYGSDAVDKMWELLAKRPEFICK